MQQSTKLHHTRALSNYLERISVETKKLKKSLNINLSEAREMWLKEHTPFSESNSFNEWVQEREADITDMQKDPVRLRALDYDSSFKNQNNYFAFSKEIVVLVDGKDNSAELTLRPSFKLNFIHSSWVGSSKLLPNIGVRQATPDIDVKQHIKMQCLLDRPVYIINSLDNFYRWGDCWGGDAVIAEKIFCENEIDINTRKLLLDEFMVSKA